MTIQYVATINVPGYLPTDDDPPVFDTAAEAWRWLADERMRDEDQYPGIPDDPSDPDGPCHYSDTVGELESEAGRVDVDGNSMASEGTIYGRTPGCDADDTHDLGLAYSVTGYPIGRRH